MANIDAQAAPIRPNARIETIDVIRGIAILGILYMNIDFMGTNLSSHMGDPRRLSWSLPDRASYGFMQVFLEATQRGLFELLFGAGVLIFARKAMQPTGPVMIADLFLRRNLWLFAFGVLDIFLIGWFGDILLFYGIAALFVFPFRVLRAHTQIAAGMLFYLVAMITLPSTTGLVRYLDAAAQAQTASRLEAQAARGETLTVQDSKTLDAWHARQHALDPQTPLDAESKEMAKQSQAAHAGSASAMLAYNRSIWMEFLAPVSTFVTVMLEAFCTMLIGMGLFKLGILQGTRTLRFYLTMAIGGYVIGCGLRYWDLTNVLAFTLEPNVAAIFKEPAALAVTLGHVGLINAALKVPALRTVLAPFRAAGRMAFTIYIATNVITLWFVFAPWGLDMWGRLGWFELYALATTINAGLLLLANLWLRVFACGPLEWAWRSLTYNERQPFRTPPAQSNRAQLPGMRASDHT